MTTRGTFIGETIGESAPANVETPQVSDNLKHDLTNTPVAQSQTLRDSVAIAMSKYFAHLDGQPVTDLYNMVLSEVEAPLLEAVMQYTRNNQTKASVLLGLNRGTLRKKLKQYGLL